MEDTILVVLFVLFSVGLLSTCVHQVRAQNALTQTFTASIANRRPPETEGIDPETITAFPVVKYSDVKDIKIGKGILECAVCLSEFNDEDLVRLLPECDHVFHPPCIDNWLASHATCPVCRTNLLQAPESHSSALVNDVAIHIDDEDDDRRSTANLISSEGHQIPKIPSPDTMNIRRSHSTGDSRDRRDEGFEKYELRLPEDMKKKILNREEVKQEERNGAVLGSGEECSRMAYRNVNDQFGRLGRFDRFSISDRFLRCAVKD